MGLNLNFTDSAAREFCAQVTTEMTVLFGISIEEAERRIELHWQYLDQIGGPNEVIYHEDSKFWANQIYWGDTSWWLSAEERNNKGLPELKPVDLPTV